MYNDGVDTPVLLMFLLIVSYSVQYSVLENW